MPIAFIFPGQGSQEPGMGLELYNSLTNAREILDSAGDILDFDIKSMMFEGNEKTLNDTRYSQPIIYTCNAMYLEKAKSLGIAYDYVAGHSLGEYSALYAAGMISFEEGLGLVKERGLAMSKQNGKGTMAAVIGLSEEELSKVIKDTESEVVIANLNTPKQLVISGTNEGVKQVKHNLEHANGVIIKELAVSAAFHSPQMTEASNIMSQIIDSIEFKSPKCYVVSNVTGIISNDVEDIINNLKAQITGQVRWYDSILNMTRVGVTSFYEIGHGKVLRGMNRRIENAAKCQEL